MSQVLEDARKQFKAFVAAWQWPMTQTGVFVDVDDDVVIFMKDHSEMMFDIVEHNGEFAHFEATFSVHILYDGNDYLVSESVIGHTIDSTLHDLQDLYRMCMKQIVPSL
jgi:hypothetical protein